MWQDQLRALGPFDFNPPIPMESVKHGPYSLSHVDNLMAWPGANLHAVDIKKQGDSGAWMRYMQDHASKAKQEQVAVNCGRQWGVVGRKRFKKCLPSEVYTLTDSQRDKFLRGLQRLSTPRVYDRKRHYRNWLAAVKANRSDSDFAAYMKESMPDWLERVKNNPRFYMGDIKSEVWNHRLGKRLKRGNIGRSVWFEEASKLEAVKRLIEWAKNS
ncbi:MAG TPA: hypothetical protein HPP57_07415 [Deltaproteobacteria bacterium]|nr:hypothetical protein [Deltaproteobacteria bacterium]